MPEIQIPQPKVQDIYSFGFGKDLIKEKSSQLSEFENTLRLYGDKINAISIRSEEWKSFSPSWTGSVANPSIGADGTQTFRYLKIGKLVVANYSIQFGTLTTSGTGSWRLTFPLKQNVNQQIFVGQFIVYDDSLSAYTNGTVVPLTDTTIHFPYADGSSNAVGAGSPMAWTNLDIFRLTIVYETIE